MILSPAAHALQAVATHKKVRVYTQIIEVSTDQTGPFGGWHRSPSPAIIASSRSVLVDTADILMLNEKTWTLPGSIHRRITYQL